MSDPYIPGSDGNEEFAVVSPDAGAMGIPKPGPRLETPGAGGPALRPEEPKPPRDALSIAVEQRQYEARDRQAARFAQDRAENAEMARDPNSEILQRAEQHSPDKKNILRRMYGGAKNFAKEYVKNLDPRGKDKIWWAGNLLSTSVSAYLAIQTGGASLLAKSVGQTVASMGFFAGERAIHGIRKGRIERKYAPHSQVRAEKLAQLEDKHERGTGRMRRFFLGMSAGSIYGGAAGIAIDSSFASSLWSKAQDSEFISRVSEGVASGAKSTVGEVSSWHLPFTDTSVGDIANNIGNTASNVYTEGTVQDAAQDVQRGTEATGGYVAEKASGIHGNLIGQDNIVGAAYRDVVNAADYIGDKTQDVAHTIADSQAGQDIGDLASDTKDKLFGTDQTTLVDTPTAYGVDTTAVTTHADGLVERAFDAITPDNTIKDITHAYEATTAQDVVNAVADKAGDIGEKAQEYYANALNSDVIDSTTNALSDASEAIRDAVPENISETIADSRVGEFASDAKDKLLGTDQTVLVDTPTEYGMDTTAVTTHADGLIDNAVDLVQKGYDRGTDLAGNVWDYFSEPDTPDASAIVDKATATAGSVAHTISEKVGSIG
ncbi:MAG: hypothetical protein HY430_00190 [Candidatus Levybacteria bacterium]|nr:hypothetical protein [Candidatus Levybacteria bacterium]